MEARLQAEELARTEARARQAAEHQSQEMEREVVGLQGKNLELDAEVQRLTELLHQKPKARSTFCRSTKPDYYDVYCNIIISHSCI